MKTNLSISTKLTAYDAAYLLALRLDTPTMDKVWNIQDNLNFAVKSGLLIPVEQYIICVVFPKIISATRANTTILNAYFFNGNVLLKIPRYFFACMFQDKILKNGIQIQQ